MSQPEQKEQLKESISLNSSMSSKKTISKPEIEKKIPAQIPCRQCKICLVDNPAKYDGVDRGYCSECWDNR